MSDVDRNVLRQIGRTSRAVHAAFEQEVGHGLPRWRILQALYDRRDAAEGWTQKQLVREFNIDAGALTRQLKQMESEALISRHSDPDDNRLTRVSLLQAGADQVIAAQSRREAFFGKVVAGLSAAEVQAAMKVLREIELRCQSMYQGEAD
ncbi:MarR family transcriptional regulator [Niveibacterium sp. SC-1]|uniref:MarR family winged helix-turn-helix transcriptional regulator n=1 Tax=Niveibacterium sp. SC-1 TaxID=3135646 RepID=UPI00311F2446